MHFQFMPTRFGNTKNGYIECFQGRDMVCRKDLQMFHSDFQKYITDHGIMANVNTGITKAQGGNKTIDELKAESRERSRTKEKTRKPLDIDFEFTL
jgi:hypothetical protein